MTADTQRQTTRTPSEIGFQILRFGFTVLPIVFGLDKFFDVLTQWTIFVPDFVAEVVSPSLVMGVAGVVEIVTGIGVWIRPKIFAYLVAAWLAGIIVTLAIIGGFWSIALRDAGLLLGAVALGQLAQEHS